jgi:hypothetical protein
MSDPLFHSTDGRSQGGRPSAAGGRRAVAVVLLCAAAAGCGGGPPPPAPKDVEYTQAMSTGRSAFDRGEAEQAALFFGQALRRAEARDDAADIGDAAYNLAVSWMQVGAYDRAARLLAESRREVARAGGRGLDVRLMEARCAYRGGDRPTAAAVAAEVAAAPAATPAERADALLLQAEVALDQGDPTAAGRWLAQSRAAAPATASGKSAAAATGLAAGWLGVDGRLAESNRQPAQAARLFDQQAAACQASRLYPEMTDALRRAAKSHAAAGDDRAAADRWYRASRSATAQGDAAAGVAAAREAVAAAGRAGDPGLVAGLSLAATNPATTGPADPVTTPADGKP